MNKVAFLLCGIVLTGMISGCQNDPVNTISNAGVVAKITKINDKRVETDSRLAKRLCLTEIRESKTNDGYTRIQVFLKNMTDSTYKIIYRFNWYDDQGAEVENPDNENWTRQIIVAGDDVTLTTVAPRKVCRDFKLRLKAVE